MEKLLYKKLFFLAGRRPFRISFQTNNNELVTKGSTKATTNEAYGTSSTAGPQGITGFSLNYVQQSC